jgi:hypothetical protein
VPRFCKLLFAAWVCVLSLGCGEALADTLVIVPPYIPFPNPPSNLAVAKSQLQIRRDAVITFMACGNENAFIDFVAANVLAAGEGIGPMLIGKMMWLRSPTAVNGVSCPATTLLKKADVSSVFKNGAGDIDPGTVNAANAVLTKLAGNACQGAVTSITPVNNGDQAQLVFKISTQCMRAEVNAMASQLQTNVSYDAKTKSLVRAQVGTDPKPCLSDLVDLLSTPGDADIGIRDMTRLFFLDGDIVNGKFVEGTRKIFDPATRNYVRDNLLTLHGGFGGDGYSILDCGNPDVSHDTPQDVLDEHDFLNETAQDIGDAASWFTKRFAVIALLLGPEAELAAAILSSLGEGAAAATVAAVTLSIGTITAASGVVNFTIPETENHLLMIETSRYLKNQIIIDELPNHSHIGALKDEQAGVKEWLMHYMSGIMRHDFSEYNARPYQRYSHVALLNLVDFAEDPALRSAAAMALEYTMAKFAVGSRDGIRVVPYRRRVDNMNSNQNMVEFGGTGTDFSVLMMQYLAGLSHHLPVIGQAVDDGPRVAVRDLVSQRGLHYGNARVMIYPASSTFAPDDAILDLAIDKSTPYFQRVHHDAIEIYANLPGVTLSAGGLGAPPGRQLLLDDKNIPIGGQLTDDKGGPGTGVPTSLIFEGAPPPPVNGPEAFAVNRLAMMRFEGAIKDVGHVCQPGDSLPADKPKDATCPGNTGFGDEGRTYDRNACVWSGFACGFNYRDDQYISASCFVPGLDNAPARWSFLNSANCNNLTGGKSATFVARYLLNCDGRDDCPPGRQFGFFEAVDASGDSSAAAFDAFRRKVVTSNPGVFPNNDVSGGAIEKEGVYQTFSGVSVRFKIDDGKASRVTRVFGGLEVPDIADWPFLDGDVLNSKGDGVVTFKNPNTKQSILWDFSDDANPRRTSQP